jgi:mono/diheme cytochrome c family protein
MSRFCSLKSWLTAAGLAMVVAMIVTAASLALAKDADVKPAKKKLTGEQLYAINCNRCHSERYATERTAAQWKTIMFHMRVRANLPADQAKAILKYMQEESGK